MERRRLVIETLKRLLTIAVVGLSFAFVFHAIAKGWSSLDFTQLTVSMPLAALAFVLTFVNFFFIAWAWAVVFREVGEPAGIGQTFSILYCAQVGKYIPGKVWLVLGQLHMAHRLGFRRTTALTAGVVQFLYGTCGALLVLGASAAVAGEDWVHILVPLAIGVAAAGALLAAPSWVERIIGRLQAWRGAEPIKVAIGPRAAIAVIGIMALGWVEHCAAFLTLVAALTPIDAAAAGKLAFGYILAYHAALLVLIAPGGIGVREGTVTALTAPTIGAAMAGIVALVQRLMITAAELVAFGVAVLIARRAGNAADQPSRSAGD